MNSEALTIIGINRIFPRVDGSGAELPVDLTTNPNLLIVSDRINDWSHLNVLHEVTPDFIKNVVRDYIRWDNLQNGHEGAKAGHKTLVNGIVPPQFLPAIKSVYEWAIEHNEIEIQRSAAIGIYILQDGLNVLNSFLHLNNSDTGRPFSQLRSAAMEGDARYQRFLTLMNIAKHQIALCLSDPVVDTISSELPVVIVHDNKLPFGQLRELALLEYAESMIGIDLGPSFIEHLMDPTKKILVVACDINGTWNRLQTYASQQDMERAMDKLREMIADFRKAFPNKEIITPFATGNSADYLRGFMDAIHRESENEIAIAENGGMSLSWDGPVMSRKIMVENERMWQHHLEEIRTALTQQISDQEIEWVSKESMLSIKIAEPTGDGLKSLLTANDGTPVTEEWISLQIQNTLREKEKILKNRLKGLNKSISDETPNSELIKKTLTKVGKAGLDRKKGTGDDLTADAFELFDEVNKDLLGYRRGEIKRIHEDLQTIRLMKRKLKAQLNRTVGYVDIYHEDQNKISGIMQSLEARGYSRDEVILVVIGDSIVDVPLREHTKPEEVNYGADDTWFVAVKNCSSEASTAAQERSTFQRGVLAAREDIHAVIDTVQGIIRSIEQSRREINTLI